MKRGLSFLLIISLLFSSWVGSDRVAAESDGVNGDKNVIQTTIQDMSGIDRQLNIDVVNEEGVRLDSIGYAMEYSQVSDGHYYYLRKVGEKKSSEKYTIYQDAGEKVGSFWLRSDENSWEFWGGIVQYQSKFYIRIEDSYSDKVKIAEVDLINEKTDTICQIPKLGTGSVVFYDNAIYSFFDSDYKKNHRVEKWSMTGEFIEKYPVSNVTDFMTVADGKIYYFIIKWKKHKAKLTFRSLDMESGQDEKVLCYLSEKVKDGFRNISFLMDGPDVYICEEIIWKIHAAARMETAKRVYYLSTQSGTMEKIGNADMIDFAYNAQYYFYIDKKHRLHRQDRQTGKDRVISNIKMAKVSCTPDGLYVEKHDPWFFSFGFTIGGKDDYSRTLYYMEFSGKNVQKIEKRKKGHF